MFSKGFALNMQRHGFRSNCLSPFLQGNRVNELKGYRRCG